MGDSGGPEVESSPMKVSGLFGRAQRPEPLQFMSQSDYDRMVNLVRGWLIDHGHEFAIDKVGGFALVGPKGSERHKIGFTNMGQVCAQTPHSDWPKVVNEFLETLVNPNTEFLEDPPFGKVRQLLKLRLNATDLGVDPALLTLYDVSDRFLTYLVIDLPKQVCTVKPETVAGWEISKGELFKLALANVWDQDKVEVKWMDLDENVKIAVLEGETFFTSTHLLMLDRHFPSQPRAGMLVAVPARHAVMVRPLEKAEDIGALGMIAYLANRTFEDGPGSITDTVFWIRDGKLTPLEIDVMSNAVNLLGPPEFEEVLALLQ